VSERADGQLSFFTTARGPRRDDVTTDARRPVNGAERAAHDDHVHDVHDAPPRLAIELRRGSTRRRHVEGVLRGETLVVSFPPRMARAEAERIADELRRRMERRLGRERIDLVARARRLARELGLPQPARVEWSDRQQHRWGSCTPVDRCIRLSSRLAAFPSWVLDYVLVHELAHLRHADHGPEFHALVDRYPKAERAIGFLIAQSIYPDHA
jgi:predicted metal-dependent hydrolase